MVDRKTLSLTWVAFAFVLGTFAGNVFDITGRGTPPATSDSFSLDTEPCLPTKPDPASCRVLLADELNTEREDFIPSSTIYMPGKESCPEVATVTVRVTRTVTKTVVPTTNPEIDEEPEYAPPKASSSTDNLIPSFQNPLMQGSRWRFVRYVPSSWENEWVEYANSEEYAQADRKKLPICKRLIRQDGELEKTQDMIRLISEMMPETTPWNYSKWVGASAIPQYDPHRKLRSIWTDDVSQHSLLSKLIYSVDASGDGGSRKEIAAFIEPLVGHLRHPFHCFNRTIRKGLLDTSYLILDRRLPASHQMPTDVPQPPPPFSTMYFDLGATMYPKKPTGESWGSSQGFFPTLYKKLGLAFDTLSLWEITQHAASEIFQFVPQHLLGGYQYFNVPVSQFKKEPEESEWNSIRVLRSKLEAAQRQQSMLWNASGLPPPADVEGRKQGVSGSPTTYVVFKLDIDTPAPENGVVARLLELLPGRDEIEGADPEIEVHEFFFEHHTNVLEVVGAVWCKGSCPTLAESYSLFQTLRKRGVRAHSWI